MSKFLTVVALAATAISVATPALARPWVDHTPNAAREAQERRVQTRQTANGGIERTVSEDATDRNGTRRTYRSDVDVNVNNDGTSNTTVKTKKTTDPKGLFNKQTVKVKDTAKVREDGGVVKTHQKTVNGRTVEESETSNR